MTYLLVSGDFVETGGMDRCNHALATYLAGRGDEVHLVAHRAADDLLGRPGVVLHRAAKPLGSYLLGAPVLDRLGRRVAARVAARGGRVVVNGGNCLWGDVNWVHYVHAAWAPRPSGGPARRIRAMLARRQALRGERACLPRARLILANSERTRRDLIERLGVAPERVHTVYLGVDAARFRPADAAGRARARARLGWDGDDRPAAAFVGAPYDDRKGFDVVFEAWRLLAREASWDARLVVAGGDGAALEAWRSRAAGAGLAGSTRFLGLCRDVPAVLAACDVLVSPARYEAYGLGVQEALCCGLPALVSASAGVAEQYPDGLRELLIPDPDDVADLAARLRAWRGRAGAYRAAVAPVSDRLRENTWERMSARIVALIEGTTDCEPRRATGFVAG